MDLASLPLYWNIDPDKRDYSFYDNAITILRRDWRNIVNLSNARYLRELLDGTQSIKKVIDSFADKDFKRDNAIVPLRIMSVFMNRVIEDIRSSPPKANLKAEDPTSQVLKKQDIELLKNRKVLERDRSELQSRVGLPGYKLPQDSYNGNINKFDELGFNENDPDDINFFGGNYHALNFEIAGQQLINSVLKLQKFDKFTVQKYVRDAMALNTICGDCYVDRVTGEIKTEYIWPEDYFNIASDTEDGKYDVCKGWQRSVTIEEFLSRVGNNFNWATDWTYMLWAINYRNNYKYTGFMRNGMAFDCCGNPDLMQQCNLPTNTASNLLDWNMAYRYKVYMGKIQWLCPEATETYLNQKNNESNPITVPFTYPLKTKKQKAEYEKESWYQWQTYESYFLATTSTSQYLFKYGKVYQQLLEGECDEYSRYTIWHYQYQGSSVAEIAEPFLNIANFTFWRLMWVIYKAKPEDDQYMVEELLEISKAIQRLYPQQASNGAIPQIDNILTQAIQFQREKSIRLRSYPKAEGKTIPQLPDLRPQREGLDPIATAMQQLISWAQNMIAMHTGINPILTGGNPPARESYKTEQSIVANSQQSTNYVYRMIQYMKEHMATVVTLYAQDIVNYNQDSLAYKWIERMIGTEKTEALGLLEKFAAHRYGIFVDDFNQKAAKDKLEQVALLKWEKGTLTSEQLAILQMEEDYKRAWQLIAYIERKNEKKLRNQAVQDKVMEDNMAQNQHDRIMEEKNFDRETQYGVADRHKEGTIEAAKLQGTSRVDTKKIQVSAEPNKQQQKALADKELEDHKQLLQEQSAMPTV